ncbi:PEN family class A beta-lactamase, Bpc-type [Streptomyces albiaxialis]|uniref:Beta-lactamase n=1 Tax=Streptomyces albiaxialis TaxID=329523 RepID=A0ABP5HZC4_9ACTN
MHSTLTRRRVLTLGAGTAAALTTLTVAAPGTATATPTGQSTGQPRGKSAGAAGLEHRFSALEKEYAARLGVFALDPSTGATVAHRARDRFPLCSVFKALAAAAVLRDLDHHGEFLAKRLHYTAAYVRKSGYSPVTGKAENIEHGMTVGELCAATVGESDNTAGNLLLQQLGGPTAITRFSRSLGDRETRLDRWEPELNSAEPWRETDTTTPRALGGTLGRLLLGSALERPDRERLTGWLVANTTNTERFREALPGWTLADKTGGGSAYGVANDAGVVRPPDGPPLVLVILSAKHDPQGPTDNPLVARAARLAAHSLVAGRP